MENLTYGFAYGLIPFTGGNFKQYSHQDEIEGNGLFTLVNISMVGAWFVITDNDTFVVRFGEGTWRKNSIFNNNDLPDKLDESHGIFFGAEKSFEKTYYKHLIEFNYYKKTTVLDGDNLETSDVFGLGYSFENYRHGYVLYTIASKNYTEPEHPKIGHLQGGSLLLGAKKYFDVLMNEFDIGYEHYKTYDDFFSGGSGDIWDSDYGNLLGNRFTTNKVYIDYIINGNFIININAFRKDYEDSLYNRVSGIETGISYRF
jgi:hypothetical protein